VARARTAYQHCDVSLLDIARDPRNIQVLHRRAQRPKIRVTALDRFEQRSRFGPADEIDGVTVTVTGLEKPKSERTERPSRAQLARR
jgi:hypothetical protein